MIVFYSSDLSQNEAALVGDEHKHCIRVLRHKLGDTVHLMDGKGTKALGRIKSIDKLTCDLDLLEKDTSKEPEVKRSIAIAPTKNNTRLEWFLEKSTEIGITDIYPVVFNRSERKKLKMERLEKIILSATKQSLRYYKPTLHALQPFPKWIDQLKSEHDQRFIAHYSDDNPLLRDACDQSKSSLVLIGPEGDFSQEEILLSLEKQFISVNLSRNRLRTETAGLVALQQLI